MSQGQGTSTDVADLGPNTDYVLDAGPLLCIGGFKYLRDIVTARCHGKAHWVEAVRAELLHRSVGTDRRAHAARSYNGRGAAWLTAVVTFTTVDEHDLNPIKGRLKALGDAKARRKRRPPQTDPRANLGEAQSILLARRHSHTLLAHDGDARTVSKEHGVASVTLVDLARRLVAEGSSAKQLASGFLTLQRDGIDTGEHITGQLDLAPRRRPPAMQQQPGIP